MRKFVRALRGTALRWELELQMAIHNAVQCDGARQWECCVEYVGGDHFLVEVEMDHEIRK